MVQAHVRQLPSIERPLSERRSFARHKARLEGILTLHGRFQRVLLHNISRSGVKLKNAFGLVPGDVVTVELLSDRTLEGTVMWSVAPYTGIAFDDLLADNDPLLDSR
jgi:PilZ domain-containing protein